MVSFPVSVGKLGILFQTEIAKDGPNKGSLVIVVGSVADGAEALKNPAMEHMVTLHARLSGVACSAGRRMIPPGTTLADAMKLMGWAKNTSNGTFELGFSLVQQVPHNGCFVLRNGDRDFYAQADGSDESAAWVAGLNDACPTSSNRTGNVLFSQMMSVGGSLASTTKSVGGVVVSKSIAVGKETITVGGAGLQAAKTMKDRDDDTGCCAWYMVAYRKSQEKSAHRKHASYNKRHHKGKYADTEGHEDGSLQGQGQGIGNPMFDIGPPIMDEDEETHGATASPEPEIQTKSKRKFGSGLKKAKDRTIQMKTSMSEMAMPEGGGAHTVFTGSFAGAKKLKGKVRGSKKEKPTKISKGEKMDNPMFDGSSSDSDDDSDDNSDDDLEKRYEKKMAELKKTDNHRVPAESYLRARIASLTEKKDAAMEIDDMGKALEYHREIKTLQEEIDGKIEAQSCPEEADEMEREFEQEQALERALGEEKRITDLKGKEESTAAKQRRKQEEEYASKDRQYERKMEEMQRKEEEVEKEYASKMKRAQEEDERERAELEKAKARAAELAIARKEDELKKKEQELARKLKEAETRQREAETREREEELARREQALLARKEQALTRKTAALEEAQARERRQLRRSGGNRSKGDDDDDDDDDDVDDDDEVFRALRRERKELSGKADRAYALKSRGVLEMQSQAASRQAMRQRQEQERDENDALSYVKSHGAHHAGRIPLEANVKLSRYAPLSRCLKSKNEVGTLVADDGRGAMPYQVRNRDGKTSWYSEEDLEETESTDEIVDFQPVEPKRKPAAVLAAAVASKNVTIDGRLGVIVWDGRPAKQYIKVTVPCPNTTESLVCV